MTEKKQKNARVVVIEALIKQEQDGYSNLVLDAVIKKNCLEPREIALVSAIFYGVLERCFTLDWMLLQCMNKPLEKLDVSVKAILRAGLYQAIYLESIPVSAAVNESVKLTRIFRKASASGFVNAVLRKAIKQNPKQAVFSTEQEEISVKYSVSLPIAAHFLQYYGKNDTESILAAFFEKPSLFIRVNPLKSNCETVSKKLQQDGWNTINGPLPNSLLVSGKGNIVQSSLFQEGLFHIQGLGSQLACFCLSPTPNSKTIDLCAAPGGKSATLAQYMNNTGVLLVGDAAQTRVPLIEQTLERIGIKIGKVQHWDAREYREELKQADFVLCDVPCSGLGIMAKKPDIRLKTLDTIQELYPLQKQILETAASYVKRGGRLVYSTCTLNPEENELQIESFLKDHSDFHCVQPQNVPEIFEMENGMVTLRPDKNLQDGFFVAVLERF